MASTQDDLEQLPSILAEHVRRIVKRVRMSRRVRRDVRAELVDHFSQALADCQTDEQRQARAAELIEQFGDAAVLGALIRRGKKRCRPAWVKAMIRTAQAFGLLIVCFILYSVWFLSGRATIRVDYVAQANHLSRPSIPTAENAWPHYAKAIELYVPFMASRAKPPWEKPPSDEDPSEYRQRVQNWLDANEAAWAECVTASRLRHCWLEYEAPQSDTSMPGVGIPHLSKIRRTARSALWRAWEDLQAGRTDEGLETLLTVLRVGRHWHRPGSTFIEQLVGIVIMRRGYEGLLRAATRFELSGEQLARLQGDIEALYPDGYLLADLAIERLIFHDVVQRSFTEGGLGGGHLVPWALRWLEDHTNDSMLVLTPGSSMVHARRNETLKAGEAIYRLAAQRSRLTPYQLRAQGLGVRVEKRQEQLTKYRYFLISMVVPSLDRAGELVYQSKATHEATLTILALRRWRVVKGEYPDGLADLVGAGYLKQLPDDPYSAGPLVYRRQGDDFILYSVAADYVDNGGTPIKSEGPRYWMYWGGEYSPGDNVFWPVARGDGG